jgi:hypothetical protein
MKKYLRNTITLIGCCTAFFSCSISGVDLEKITLKEDVTTLVKDRQKSVDKLEMLTGLPGYLLTDIKGYRFGNVEVPDGGSVEFLFTSLAEKKIAGVDINFKTDTTAKAITAYLFEKYGKPTKIIQKENTVFDSTDNAYRSSAVYLWSNIKPGISMVLFNRNEEINKQPWYTAELIIIWNEVVPASPLNASTSLNRIIQNYTPLD